MVIKITCRRCRKFTLPNSFLSLAFLYEILFLKNWIIHECMLYWICDNCSCSPSEEYFQNSNFEAHVSTKWSIRDQSSWWMTQAVSETPWPSVIDLNTQRAHVMHMEFNILPILSCALRLFQHVLAWCTSGFSFCCCSAENVISACD